VAFADFNMISSIGGFGFGISQLLFVYIVWSAARRQEGHRAVWEGAKGLEWTVPSPAPHHTFTTPPVIDDSKLAHGDVRHDVTAADAAAHAPTIAPPIAAAAARGARRW
jgi:cytochrome c oxidase subunit I